MKTNRNYSIKLLKQFVVLVVYLLPVGLSAQNDAHKAFINRTGFAVLEAQKAVVAAHKTNVDGKLARLVQLQMQAVVLFNKKEYALASYTSNQAREEAVQLIATYKGFVNSLYTNSDDAKNLFADAQAEAALTKENLPSFSGSDQDYLAPRAIAIEKIQVQ